MKKKLLQAWLQFTEGDILELLHRLDVENCPEVAVPVLNAVFSLSPLNDCVQNCKYLDNRYGHQLSFLLLMIKLIFSCKLWCIPGVCILKCFGYVLFVCFNVFSNWKWLWKLQGGVNSSIKQALLWVIGLNNY